MAIEWFVGVDSENAGCVKIMASDLYDPYLTRDTDFSKFLFNSKWDTNVRFVGTDTQLFADGEFQQFYPPGSNRNNFWRFRLGDDIGTVFVFWRREFWDNLGTLDYDLPVFDVKTINNSGAYIYNKINAVEGNFSTQYRLATSSEEGYCTNFNAPGAQLEFTMAHGIVTYPRPNEHKVVSIWNLPADETDILNPALAPVIGQTQVQITKDFCRVSKPGYAVETATPSQLAFDSASRPAKIVAAGDIALPTGTTVFDFSANLAGIVTSGQLVADVIQYEGGTVFFPASLPEQEGTYGASYVFSGNTLVFNNSDSPCRARILIIAQDGSPLTVGDNDVWREFNDGTQDVVQFLRPGAANPPSLADVIIDSRWPCLQIVKTGVFNIPNGAAQQTAIPFDSAGLFPFIKYFTIHGAGEPNSTGMGNATASKRVRLPIVMRGFARNPDTGSKIYFISGVTTYCRMTANEARFYTYRGQNYRVYYDQNSNNQYVLHTEDVTCPAYAIRYYIFGIPA